MDQKQKLKHYFLMRTSIVHKTEMVKFINKLKNKFDLKEKYVQVQEKKIACYWKLK